MTISGSAGDRLAAWQRCAVRFGALSPAAQLCSQGRTEHCALGGGTGSVVFSLLENWCLWVMGVWGCWGCRCSPGAVCPLPRLAEPPLCCCSPAKPLSEEPAAVTLPSQLVQVLGPRAPEQPGVELRSARAPRTCSVSALLTKL